MEILRFFLFRRAHDFFLWLCMLVFTSSECASDLNSDYNVSVNYRLKVLSNEMFAFQISELFVKLVKW